MRINHWNCTNIWINRTKDLFASLALLATLGGPVAAAPLGTAFTYQGHLEDAGAPANAAFDFTWRLFDSPTNPAALATSALVGNLPVSNGLFTATVEFGPGQFNGEARWLETWVRPAGNPFGSWTVLAPRQPVTPAPYALHAAQATDAAHAAAATTLAGPVSLAYSNADSVLLVRNTGGGPSVWAETTNATALFGVNYGDGNALFVANLGSGPCAVFQGGNVGIGTQSPEEKLSVNGVIQSQAGGFKFPDRTVQTTAAANWRQNQSGGTYYNDGNVGVGTDAPTTQLHLNGPFAPTGLRLETARAMEGMIPFVATNGTGSVGVSGGGPAWSGAGNILASDDARATQTLAYNGPAVTGQALLFTNLGFSLPADAVIWKIEVLIEQKYTTTSPCNTKEIKTDMALLGNDSPGLQPAAYFTEDNESVIQPYGLSVATTWGLKWTAAQINSPAFGVVLRPFADFRTEVVQDPNCPFCFTSEPCDTPSTTTLAVDQVRVVVSYYHGSGLYVSPVNYTIGVPENSQALVIAPGATFANPSPGIGDGGLVVNTNGMVGIGTIPTNDFFKLDVDGNIRCIHLTETSSARYKQDVQPLLGALDTVGRLQGVSYRWDAAHGGRRDIGFIAEQVGQVVPEIVAYESPDGPAAGLNYGRLTALTVEAIKELKVALASRDEEIRALRQRLEQVERDERAAPVRGGAE